MVAENFRLGLQVTGLGMGLVFLTLILIMLLIYLLERIFRPEAAEEATEAPVSTVGGAASGTEPVAGPLDAEAAAIAVAIALEKERGTVYDEEIVGEVVMVTLIEPQSGAWRGYGRLKAMQ